MDGSMDGREAKLYIHKSKSDTQSQSIHYRNAALAFTGPSILKKEQVYLENGICLEKE